MNRTTPLGDGAIRDAFTRRARRADVADLQTSILHATVGLAQRRIWTVRLGGFADAWKAPRALVFGLIAAALIGGLFVFGVGRMPDKAPIPSSTASPMPSSSSTTSPSATPSVSPSPAPSRPPFSIANHFIRRFESSIPVSSTLKLKTGQSDVRSIWAFYEGPVSDHGASGLVPDASDTRGVIVVSGEAAWTHSCNPDVGRKPLRSAPAEFVEDLASIAGAELTVASAETLDGHPALSTTKSLPACGVDLHISTPMAALAGGTSFVDLAIPSRFIVAEVNSTTVLVDIWARTDEELVAWLPTAMEFVDSIHFIDQP